MGPTSSVELSAEERATLLETARRGVAHGVATGQRLEVDPTAYPPSLREDRACFVTLRIDGELRGCVGSLRARGPLVSEVARSAFMAAFRDPRFPPLKADELERVHVHVSVLTTPAPLPVSSEADLLAKLRPNVDGLILREGSRVGTFLPDVWESIPDPAVFVRQLKLKAGMGPQYWSDAIEVERYQTESFE